MAFNVNKCKIMHCGDKAVKHEYEMNGKPLLEAQEERHLPLIICYDLK